MRHSTKTRDNCVPKLIFPSHDARMWLCKERSHKVYHESINRESRIDAQNILAFLFSCISIKLLIDWWKIYYKLIKLVNWVAVTVLDDAIYEKKSRSKLYCNSRNFRYASFLQFSPTLPRLVLSFSKFLLLQKEKNLFEKVECCGRRELCRSKSETLASSCNRIFPFSNVALFFFVFNCMHNHYHQV